MTILMINGIMRIAYLMRIERASYVQTATKRLKKMLSRVVHVKNTQKMVTLSSWKVVVAATASLKT